MTTRADMATAKALVDTVRLLSIANSKHERTPDGMWHLTVRTAIFRSVLSYAHGSGIDPYEVRIIVRDREVFRATMKGTRQCYVHEFHRGKWEELVLKMSPIDSEAGHA